MAVCETRSRRPVEAVRNDQIEVDVAAFQEETPQPPPQVDVDVNMPSLFEASIGHETFIDDRDDDDFDSDDEEEDEEEFMEYDEHVQQEE